MKEEEKEMKSPVSILVSLVAHCSLTFQVNPPNVMLTAEKEESEWEKERKRERERKRGKEREREREREREKKRERERERKIEKRE